ncbi:MAG TPA: PEP-CTERM sorting domain-containing protein [Myxococcales bacterium]|nr:PEP-CTERM sorting domain-containing protein [Myxococcales bacterium]HIL80720.1 PEP-CTERM sorting domain-containing protein [Myxococcales bacterium]
MPEDSLYVLSPFAVWSPVPEPSTALLLPLGLTGLVNTAQCEWIPRSDPVRS